MSPRERVKVQNAQVVKPPTSSGRSGLAVPTAACGLRRRKTSAPCLLEIDMGEPYKLSEAQRGALQDLAAGLDPTRRLSGRSEFGGYARTLTSLTRRGWVDPQGRITDAGRAALKTGGDHA